MTAACRRYRLLGCFVYLSPVGDRPGAARRFAPAIDVDEDVANANSAGCVAAHLPDFADNCLDDRPADPDAAKGTGWRSASTP